MAPDDRDSCFVTVEAMLEGASVATIIKPRAIAARGVRYKPGT